MIQFQPTKQQFKWLQSALKPELSGNITAISKDSGVSRVNWYRWSDDVDFMNWYNRCFKREVLKLKSHLYVIAMKKAEEGDFRFWEKLMNLAENFVEETSSNVDFNRLTLKERITLSRLYEKAQI